MNMQVFAIAKVLGWGPPEADPKSSSQKQTEVTSEMVRCSLEPENPTKSGKSRGSNVRVHFKDTCETAHAIKGMHIRKDTKNLKDVTVQKRHVPFCP